MRDGRISGGVWEEEAEVEGGGTPQPGFAVPFLPVHCAHEVSGQPDSVRSPIDSGLLVFLRPIVKFLHYHHHHIIIYIIGARSQFN